MSEGFRRPEHDSICPRCADDLLRTSTFVYYVRMKAGSRIERWLVHWCPRHQAEVLHKRA